MAIYHLHMQTISRSDGRSAVAAAAYRSASRLCDSHGTVFDYRRKAGVVHGEIAIPHGFPRIDRQALWLAAESAEKRKNSTVAREIDVALPIECSREEQLEIVSQFCSWIAEKWQVAVDFNLHYSTNAAHAENPHAHIQFTTRHYGFDGKLAEKTREFDDLKTRKQCLMNIREKWADVCNQYLSRHGTTIDHRSYAAQGIEQVPGIHLGQSVVAMKRKGICTDRDEEHLSIERVNRARKKIQEEEQYVRSRLANMGEEVCGECTTAGIGQNMEADQFHTEGTIDGNTRNQDHCASNGDGGCTCIQRCGGNDQSSCGAGGRSYSAEGRHENSVCPAEIETPLKNLKAVMLDLKWAMFQRVDRTNADLLRRHMTRRSIVQTAQLIHSDCRRIKKQMYCVVRRKNAHFIKDGLKRMRAQHLDIPDGYIECQSAAQDIHRELRQIRRHLYARVDAANLRQLLGQNETHDNNSYETMRM